MSDVPAPYSLGPPVRVVPAAELASWRFDDTRILGDALALLGGIPTFTWTSRIVG